MADAQAGDIGDQVARWHGDISSRHSGTARQRRARNPERSTVVASGFRVRSLARAPRNDRGFINSLITSTPSRSGPPCHCHIKPCISTPMHDVTFLAALIAGLVSFLSPCVLPLVPPYLVFLAGTSLERLADQEPEPRVKRETVLAAVLFVAGFSHGVRGARRQRQRGRLADPRLFRAARHRRRRDHHYHGAAFPRADADRLAASAEAAGGFQARRACGAPM